MCLGSLRGPKELRWVAEVQELLIGLVGLGGGGSLPLECRGFPLGSSRLDHDVCIY